MRIYLKFYNIIQHYKKMEYYFLFSLSFFSFFLFFLSVVTSLCFVFMVIIHVSINIGSKKKRRRSNNKEEKK